MNKSSSSTRVTRARAVAPKETVVKEVAPTNIKRKFPFSIQPVTLVMGVLLVVAIGVAGYFYYQSKHSAQLADAKEIEELTKTIGQFVELPDGETPTLATVTDREKLADQPFFVKAENGDKVLIYSQSGRAILYRPSTKKIVDMTSVNLNQATQSQTETQTNPNTQADQQPQQQSAETATVALFNASTKIGVTDLAEKQIGAGLPDVKIVAKEKAIKTDSVGIVVVDVTGKYADKANALASLLGGQVGSLPEGESAPQSDIAVFIGNSETPTPAPAPAVTPDKKKN